MKTAVVWIEYESESKPNIHSYEYATIGDESAEYQTLKDFLDSIKKLARSTGYRLNIKNVVIG